MELPGRRNVAKGAALALWVASSLLVSSNAHSEVADRFKRHDAGYFDCAATSRADTGRQYRITPDTLTNNSFPNAENIYPRWVPHTRNIIMSMPCNGDGAHEVIKVVDTLDDKARIIGSGSQPIPAPDGKLFVYIDVYNGKRRLFVSSVDGSMHHLLATVPGAINLLTERYQGIAWSPDSTRIVVGYQEGDTGENEGGASAADKKPNVLDMAYSNQPEPIGIIEVVNLATGSATKVDTGPFVPLWVSWLGSNILFDAVHYGSDYRDGMFWGQLRLVDMRSRKERVLLRNRGVTFLQPQPSRDGKQIAFCDDPNNLYFPFNLNISLLSTRNSVLTSLTSNATFPHFIWGMPLGWSPRGTSLYFRAKTSVFTNLYQVTLKRQIAPVYAAPENVLNYDISPDGRGIVLAADDAYGHQRIVALNADGSNAHVLVDINPQVKKSSLGHVRRIQWRSRDRLPIAGLLILPHNYNPLSKYPLVVDIHGGPTGGISLSGSLINGTPLEWHLWCALGFVVFIPDYRSSEVPGWKPFVRGIRSGTFQKDDLDDIMSGVDYVIAHYSVDSKRMAVIGHSTGALKVNWIITHTHRFRAAISYEGWAENYMQWSAGDRIGGDPSTTWQFGGLPWQVPRRYLGSAPAMYVKGVTTPTLFVSGRDGIANYHNEFMYRPCLSTPLQICQCLRDTCGY